MILKLQFVGDLDGLTAGLYIMSDELGFIQTDSGFRIRVERRVGPIEVSKNANEGFIRFEKKNHFFRALGLWIEKYEQEHDFTVIEEPQFTTNGVMIDASRNAVMTVEGIQKLLRIMAIMGLDLVMMYTEDTFEMEKYPYFGYMRGRYTEDELKACDDYAANFGIEMIPCIQTLAHLQEALKWNYAGNMKDTDDILLVGAEETYEFIEEMVKTASRPFRSNRIHIGMDEAHQLGLGTYLAKNGFKKRFDIMNEHLQRVISITDRYQLKPMIWSDMYFRLGSKTGNYYDLEAEIPQDVIDSIPKHLQLVYWDYYHTDEDFYKTFIEKHHHFGAPPVFAGGVWTWNGIAPNYGLTFRTTNAALAACKKTGTKEVFATMWGDNGAETPSIAGLLGMQLFAEHGYTKDVDFNRLAERFQFCVKGNMEDFLALSDLDETPGVMKDNLKESNPSKFLLYQDVLIGLYDQNIQGLPMNDHYKKLADRLYRAKERNPRWNQLFDYYGQLAEVLSVKAEMGLKLKTAYDHQNHKQVKQINVQLRQLIEQLERLRKTHRTLWYSINKAFGWEVLDIRYGGVITRTKTAIERIEQWLIGEIKMIEELEAERLYHEAPWVMPEGALGRNAYHRIVTAGAFSN